MPSIKQAEVPPVPAHPDSKKVYGDVIGCTALWRGLECWGVSNKSGRVVKYIKYARYGDPGETEQEKWWYSTSFYEGQRKRIEEAVQKDMIRHPRRYSSRTICVLQPTDLSKPSKP